MVTGWLSLSQKCTDIFVHAFPFWDGSSEKPHNFHRIALTSEIYNRATNEPFPAPEASMLVESATDKPDDGGGRRRCDRESSDFRKSFETAGKGCFQFHISVKQPSIR